MKKTSSEHYSFIFFHNYQNKYNIGSDCPPTSSQILPTSGSSDWPKWDPYMVYTTGGWHSPVEVGWDAYMGLVDTRQVVLTRREAAPPPTNQSFVTEIRRNTSGPGTSLSLNHPHVHTHTPLQSWSPVSWQHRDNTNWSRLLNYAATKKNTYVLASVFKDKTGPGAAQT